MLKNNLACYAQEKRILDLLSILYQLQVCKKVTTFISQIILDGYY